jgi:5-aminolevulinate synthase
MAAVTLIAEARRVCRPRRGARVEETSSTHLLERIWTTLTLRPGGRPSSEMEMTVNPTIGNYITYIAAQIEALKTEGRYRIFVDIRREAGRFPFARHHDADGARERRIVVWCSNDYLGMAQHPQVIEAMIDVIRSDGAGAGGTRNIAGTNHYHVLLEQELASLHRKEAALLFTSAYISNEATLSTLPRLLPDCVILSDELNHASMIEGIRHSGCTKLIFRHNDVGHLDQLLASIAPDRPKLIAFESIYSMDGDFAAMPAICDLADKFHALTYLDEVHAVGMYGPQGAGLAAQFQCMDRITIVEGTLAKAVGVMGGYIGGPAPIIDAVRSFAPAFIFTTSLPPAVAAGALASLRHLRRNDTERIRHQERALTLKRHLLAAGLPVMSSPSHIVPVLVGNPIQCKRASDLLLRDHDIYIQPINYPTVPRGTERLRITPTPLHDDREMERLIEALVAIWRQLGLSFSRGAEEEYQPFKQDPK